MSNSLLYRLYALHLSYWFSAQRGFEAVDPSSSKLRPRHAALISKIDSEDSASQREINRLQQQNALRRPQLERFDRACVALRCKL
jgi:hypothetical protein